LLNVHVEECLLKNCRPYSHLRFYALQIFASLAVFEKIDTISSKLEVNKIYWYGTGARQN
jgi:hypothetical protein